jgi:hypothetical protein
MGKTICSAILLDFLLLISCQPISAHDLPALLLTSVGRDDEERATIDAARKERDIPISQGEFDALSVGLRSVVHRHRQGAWDTGSIITACFYPEVSDSAKKQLQEIAGVWLKNGNLKVDFGSPPTYRVCNQQGGGQIRIDVGGDISYSEIGVEAILVKKGKKTFNIAANVAANSDSSEFYTTALHEWGHAFSYEHEHQSPLSKCKFNKKLLYSVLAKYHWTPADVDVNFDKLTAKEAKRLIFSPFDKNSIMIYSFAATYYVDGDKSPCFVPQPPDLSEQDKKAFADLYPFGNQLSTSDVLTAMKATNFDDAFKAGILSEILKSPSLVEYR